MLTRDNVLVIGHGRMQAALRIGCEMPFHYVDRDADELSEEDVRELRDADNLTNAQTGFDFDKLAADFDDLDFSGFDWTLEEFGFTDDALPPIPDNLDAETDYDEEAEVSAKLTFANYTEYKLYENDLKQISEAAGARFSVTKV